jgi:SHS2 domain-containing protein
MPYKYLEEIGTADIAFEATERDLSELFRDAADATTNVMIDNIEAIQPRETRQIELSNDKLDMLLFDLLQELLFLKDAERLLLRMRQLEIEEKDEKLFLHGIAEGEPLDTERHHQRADVKAVTLHDFSRIAEHSVFSAGLKLDCRRRYRAASTWHKYRSSSSTSSDSNTVSRTTSRRIAR